MNRLHARMPCRFNVSRKIIEKQYVRQRRAYLLRNRHEGLRFGFAFSQIGGYEHPAEHAQRRRVFAHPVGLVRGIGVAEYVKREMLLRAMEHRRDAGSLPDKN